MCTPTHIIKYYSATKNNEILPFAATRMDPEMSILSEVSQNEKDSYHMASLILGFLGGAAAATAAKSLQLCPTLCDPIDGNPPGSPVPGILQARTLEWVAISFSNA